MELCYINNPNSLFRKYAQLVTWVGKSMIDPDIVLFLPHGYIKKLDRNIYQMQIYSRPVYTKALYPALIAIDNLAYNLGSFMEAKHIIWWYLNGGRMPDILRNFHFETETFNPDANPESTSVDGYSQRSIGGVGEIFSTLRTSAGNAASDVDTSEICVNLEASATTDQYNNFLRGFFLFDSSALPDTAELQSANFSLFVSGKVDQLSQSVGVILTSPASNTAIVAGDYLNITYTRQATDKTITSITTSAYNDWALNATGLANISKTGITKFGTAVSADIDNSAPTWASTNAAKITVNWADNASNKPKLSVTYTDDSNSGGVFILQ